MDVRRITSVGARVVLCLAVEGVVLLLLPSLLFMRWPILCGGQCSEAEAWIGYLAVTVITAGLSLAYVVLSVVLGRTPLMVVARVPGLWKVLRGRRTPAPR